MVAARLQGHVGGRTASGFTGLVQGMNFGMGFAGLRVPAFADDDTIPDQDAADPGIGRRGKQPPLSQAQGLRHVGVIGGGKHQVGLARDFLAEARAAASAGETSRMAWEKASTSSKLR